MRVRRNGRRKCRASHGVPGWNPCAGQLTNEATMSLAPADGSATATALVWDWPLRVFHWSLVLAVAGSFATHYAGIEWFDWHRRLRLRRAGAGRVPRRRGVSSARGTRGSRRSCAVRRAILDYLRGRRAVPGRGPQSARRGSERRALFLVLLAVQAGTGLFANDEIANAGPFYGWVTQETSNRLTALHDLNSNVLLGAHRAASRRRRVVRLVRRRRPGARDSGRAARQRAEGIRPRAACSRSSSCCADRRPGARDPCGARGVDQFLLAAS